MDETEDIKTIEFNFNQKLTAEPLNVDALIDELKGIHEIKAYHADKMASALQDKLVELHDVDGLVKVLAVKAAWNGDSLTFGMPIPQVLRRASSDRNFLRNIDNAKFGKVRPTESLRRLSVLQSLTAGKCYFDKTWGYGEVREVDSFNARVYIDFPNKPNHAMSFEYAAETLKDVSPNHLLAFRHRDPEGFAAMLAKEPGKIVRKAIESFGPSTVIRLQTLPATHDVVPAAAWKDFWARARKDLGGDKLIDIPAKRSDPIRLLSSALSYDDAWFEEFRKERDIPKIFATLSAYETAASKPEITPLAREVLDNRLTFAINGAFLHKPPMFTRLVLMAQRLKVSTPRDKLVEALLDDERFLMAGDKLPAGEAGEMVDFIVSTRPEAVGALLDTLPQMNYSLLKQTLDVLRKKPEFLQALKDRVRELLSSATPPATLVVWALRDLKWEDRENWMLPSLYELMEHAIAICEDQAAAGEKLHMQHYVKDLYLKDVMRRVELAKKVAEAAKKGANEAKKTAEGDAKASPAGAQKDDDEGDAKASPAARGEKAAADKLAEVIKETRAASEKFKAYQEAMKKAEEATKKAKAAEGGDEEALKAAEVAKEGVETAKKATFMPPDWFALAFISLNPLQQEAIFMRLQGNAAVAEPRYQRELVKEMIAINPALAEKKRSAAPVAAEAPEQHFSSWRSLRVRQEQFRHLVEVEIPKNTQDISFARGYGDLRENFEYQSAKDQQRILLARREEWGAELEKMHGSSFSETKSGYAAVEPGCEVTLEKADGSVLVYSILGEWDSDEALGIIPSRSRLAKIIEGKKVGDKATIPTVVGEEEVSIKAIAPLPDAVREWIGQPFAENA